MRRTHSHGLEGHIRNLLLLISDLACLYGVWALAVWGFWAVGFGRYVPTFYLRLWPMGIVYVVVNGIFRLYQGNWFCPSVPHSPVDEMRRLVGSSVFTHLLLIAYLVLVYQTTEDYSRALILISSLGVAFFAQPSRDITRSLMFRLGVGRIPVILSGNGETARRIEEVVATDRHLGLRVVRSVGDDVRSLVSVGRELNVKTLLACQDIRLLRAQLPELSKWYHHIEYVPMTDAFPLFGSRIVSFDGVGGIEMINHRQLAFARVEKGLLDKLLAVVAFVVFSPCFVVLPVLIKATSKGPVFYRQNRLGQYGRPLRIWKFRSMYVDAEARLKGILAEDPSAAAEWKANFKLHDDPRITPIGRFLRKTSLDELPQLFNVFAGDMAIVGPRPIVSAEVPYYGAAYEVFSSVPPGITGLWQVSGRSDTDYPSRVVLDRHYVLNWSPWMDVRIVIRTVFAVLRMKGSR